MNYIKVIWHHDFSDDPVELYCELDDGRMEVRKVEIFRDQSVGFASATETNGLTQLGYLQVPPNDEIAADPEFEVEEIDQSQFEQVWKSATD